MHMNVGMHLQQKQMMTLSPRMIQSMEILQLPVMALQERIEQEMEENIALEMDSTDNAERNGEANGEANGESNGETEWNGDDSPSTDVEERELVVDSDHNNEADFERLMEISSEWPEDNLSAGSRVSSNRMQEDGDRQHDAMSNTESRPQSLHEYLLEQFAFFNCEPDVREFGEYLIHNLDHNGRLQGSLAEIVQVFGRPIDFERAQLALSLLQKCDPPGVGARDLKECLLLQLTTDTPYRDVLVTLITSHLEDLAKNRLPVIQRKTGYSLETIKDAQEELHNLEPRPGNGFEVRLVQNVTPDLSVTQADDGKYTVKLEDEYVPQLRISQKYQQLFRNNPDAKTKEYIKKKIESAKWLIESIEQRQNTLKRVAQAIIDHQTSFLDNGPEQIVPLKMQQIADDVGVHVTTVSRAVDDKWIQTPRGLFPLKRFFGGGTTAADGSEVAWDIIRLKLKDIVDGEDKQNPLSDEALVKTVGRRRLRSRPPHGDQVP